MEFKTADLYDQLEDRLRVCAPLFADFGGVRRFAGPVSTVKCFEDNSVVKAALAEPGDAKVLVVDAGGSTRCAMLGDMLAASAVQNGWRGVVMFGCIRDSADIAAMTLGVKALGTNPRKSEKRGEGQRDIPVSFGDITFRPGDFLYADEDGIVVADERVV